MFDDTTLFNWSKYSGYDRVEGGTRANYGFQYVDNLPSGGHVNVVAGQSVQVAGQNSYTIADATNTGLEFRPRQDLVQLRRRRDSAADRGAADARPEAAVRQREPRR